MNNTNLCRLCLNVCNDCKSLYCASGQTNEIYDITVKYFHTMFSNMDQDNENTVICLECWHHISDFHSYQQSVFQAQTKLLKEVSFMEYKCSIQSTASRANTSSSIPIKEEDEDSLSVPDLELMEEFSYCKTLQTVENEDDSSNPEDSENVATIHNELHIANEADQSMRNAYNPDDSANLDPIHNGLDNANENLLIRAAYDSGDSANLGATNTEYEHNEYEVKVESEALSEQSISAECLSTGDDSMHSHGSQQINTKESKRKKPRYDIDISIAKWRKNLECVECGMMVQHFAALLLHFRDEHPTKQCYITCCGSKLRSRYMIGEHARFHNDPSAFKCSKCDVRFNSMPSLYTHKRKCLKGFQPQRKAKLRSEENDKFIAIHKPNLECVVCQETYPHFTQLKKHFQDKHPNHAFYVMCCQREFTQRSQLKEHVWLHLDPNAFKCKICGKQHSIYKNFQYHMVNVHATALKMKSIEDISAEIQKSLDSSLKDNVNQ